MAVLASSLVLRKQAHGSDHSAGTIAFVLVIFTVVVSSNERKIQSCRGRRDRIEEKRRLII